MNAKISFFLVAFALCTNAEAAVSTKRKCVDENCTVPISMGRTLVLYAAPEPGYLSFRAGEIVKIMSKDAGSNMELWGIELKGKRGYIPKKFVKEFKLLNNPEIVVDTEIEYQKKLAQDVPSSNNSESDNIIVDGTTLYNDISPTSTQTHHQQQQSAAVPDVQQIQSVDTKKLPEVKSDGSSISTSQKTNEDVSANKEELEEVIDDDYDIDSEDEDENDEDSEEKDEVEGKDVKQEISEEIKETIDTPLDIKINNEVLRETNANIEQNVNNSATLQTDQMDKQTEKVYSQPDILSSPEEPPISRSSPPKKLPMFFHSTSVIVDGEDPAFATSAEVKSPARAALPENFEKPDWAAAAGMKPIPSPPLDFSVPKVIESNEVTPEIPTVEPSPELEKVIGKIKIEEKETETSMKTSIKNNGLLIDGVQVKEVENTFQNINEFMPSEGIGSALLETKPNFVNTISNEEFTLPPDTITHEKAVPATIEEKAPDTPQENNFLTNIEKALQNLHHKVKERGDKTKESSEHRNIENIGAVPSRVEDSNVVSDHTQPETPQEPEVTTPEYTESIEMNDLMNEPEVKILHEDERIPNEDLTNQEVVATAEEQDLPSLMERAYDESKQEAGNEEEIADSETGGWLSSVLNMFGSNKESSDSIEEHVTISAEPEMNCAESNDDVLLSHLLGQTNRDSCSVDDNYCHAMSPESETPETISSTMSIEEFSMEAFLDKLVFTNIFMIVGISGACVVFFLWGYMIIEKLRKEGPLVGKINHLEQQLLIMAKENELLNKKVEDSAATQQEINENVSSKFVVELQQELENALAIKVALEEQLQSLEKELENSTEVGLELNKMLSDVLSSQNGSDTVMANIEQLQKQLAEQQGTINSVNDQLNEKDTENHELQLELEINNKKVVDLQADLENMMQNLIKAEEDTEMAVARREVEVAELREKLTKLKASTSAESSQLSKQLGELKSQLIEIQRNYDVKSKEYNLLKESLSDSDSNKNILEHSALKAELLQLQQDNKNLFERLGQEQIIAKNTQSEITLLTEEKAALKKQYEDADREKLEALTKLEVLSTYFKEKEAELQKGLSKHEAMWSEKQGESTTTSERMKFMAEEIQNFKSQVASLQQEIISQEVDLKSQISVLEKKAHENWVSARQAERRVEDARQEAAQLRNRLTLRERSLLEEKVQSRNGMSPLETNGVDHHLNDTASPPLLFGAREHMTTSPPLLPGLPPGFPLPPPPGPGIPPFLPPFMPPPPGVFPGDHRPPPLGRMSSPPLNSRYSPESREFSFYDHRSISPTDDDYYDRDYYNHRSKRNNGRRSGYSTGSNSNESLDKLDRSHSHSKV